MRFFVGLDWASEAHAVCVIDSRGGVRWRGSAAHSVSGLAALCSDCGAGVTVARWRLPSNAPRACWLTPSFRQVSRSCPSTYK